MAFKFGLATVYCTDDGSRRSLPLPSKPHPQQTAAGTHIYTHIYTYTYTHTYVCFILRIVNNIEHLNRRTQLVVEKNLLAENHFLTGYGTTVY